MATTNAGTCRRCGGILERIRRSPIERLWNFARYRCHQCLLEESEPRFGPPPGDASRCPRCWNSRLSQLAEPDRFDPMNTGLWNLVARITGGSLYFCGRCRLQFYDRRPLRKC